MSQANALKTRQDGRDYQYNHPEATTPAARGRMDMPGMRAEPEQDKTLVKSPFMRAVEQRVKRKRDWKKDKGKGTSSFESSNLSSEYFRSDLHPFSGYKKHLLI